MSSPGMETTVKGYVLTDPEGTESIMVIRTEDVELLVSIARRLTRMRDARIKQLGKKLEGDLDDRNE